MKFTKTMMILAVILLIWIKSLGAGYANMMNEDWIRDPRVSIEVSNRVDENGTYNVFYCIDDEYVVTLERNINEDTGWITLTRGDFGRCKLLYETDWGSMAESERIINDLIEQILSARES